MHEQDITKNRNKSDEKPKHGQQVEVKTTTLMHIACWSVTGEWKSSHSGAAGTTYIEENLRELEYRHKKYDPVLNFTFMAVDHSHIHADNNFAYRYDDEEVGF
jgi:hypothetical protein